MIHSFYSGLLKRIFGLLLLTAAIPAGPGWAWGPEGHRVSGLIAENFLSPAVKRKIQKDFSIKSLANASLWADQVRDERNNGAWHYCNVREGEWTYDRKRDCPKGICVVEKIKEFKTALADPSLALNKRQEALKYLVHFVGDVHQPLHLGNKKDRGGGTIRVLYRGEEATLHYLWDGGLINFHGQSFGQYADGLAAKISKEDRADWSRSREVDEWANESRKLALEHAYRLGRTDRGKLTKEYIKKSREIIELRLSQSGLRLAHLLNTVLE